MDENKEAAEVGTFAVSDEIPSRTGFFNPVRNVSMITGSPPGDKSPG